MLLKVTVNDNVYESYNTGVFLLSTDYIQGLQANGSGSKFDYALDGRYKTKNLLLYTDESPSYFETAMKLDTIGKTIVLNVYPENDLNKTAVSKLFNTKDIKWGFETNGNTWLYISVASFKIGKILVSGDVDDIIASSVNNIDVNTTLYVETTGSDTIGDGSATSPFLTLERALLIFANRVIDSGITATIQLGLGTFTWTSECMSLINKIYHESADAIFNIIGSYTSITGLTLSATADPFVYDVLISGVPPTWSVDEHKYSILNTGSNFESRNFPIVSNTATQLESYPDLSSGSIFTLGTTIEIESQYVLNSFNETIINNSQDENSYFTYLIIDGGTSAIEIETPFSFFACQFINANIYRFHDTEYVRGCVFTSPVLMTEKCKLFASNYVHSDYSDGALRFYSDAILRGAIVEGDGTNKGIEVRGGDIVSNNLTGARVGYKIKNCSHAFSLSRGTFSSGPSADQVILENCDYFLNPYGFPAELDISGLILSTPNISEIDGYSYTMDLKESIRINAPGIDPINNEVFSNILKLTPLATPPSTPSTGWVYHSTDTHFYGYNGTAWVQLDN